MLLKTNARNEFYDNFYIRKHRFSYFDKIKFFDFLKGVGHLKNRRYILHNVNKQLDTVCNIQTSIPLNLVFPRILCDSTFPQKNCMPLCNLNKKCRNVVDKNSGVFTTLGYGIVGGMGWEE